MQPMSPAAARNLWIGSMTFASIATTLVLACATPFPALAALAALYVPRKAGIILMLAAWSASQAVGYCLLDYSLTAQNAGWAFTLALAAVAALLVADRAVSALPNQSSFARLVIAYIAAFVGFKLVVLIGAVAMNAGYGAFTPDILLRQFVRYALILGGLRLFQLLLESGGLLRRDLRAAA